MLLSCYTDYYRLLYSNRLLSLFLLQAKMYLSLILIVGCTRINSRWYWSIELCPICSVAVEPQLESITGTSYLLHKFWPRICLIRFESIDWLSVQISHIDPVRRYTEFWTIIQVWCQQMYAMTFVGCRLIPETAYSAKPPPLRQRSRWFVQIGDAATPPSRVVEWSSGTFVPINAALARVDSWHPVRWR